MSRVYLDSNIIILGHKKKEHENLKNLLKEEKITLYISDHVDIELHGKVFQKLKEKEDALKIYDTFLPTGNKEIDKAIINNVKEKKDSYYKAREDEKNDRFFWKETHLMPVNSRFAGLWAVGAFDPYLNSFIQDELQKVGILMNCGVGGKDALHIIQAYCADIDYFLTWDKPLIKKIQKITWLNNLKIMTPNDFLKIKIN